MAIVIPGRAPDPWLTGFNELVRGLADAYLREEGKPKESGAFLSASGATSGAATGMGVAGPWGALAGGILGGVAGPRREHPGTGPYAQPGNIAQQDAATLQGTQSLIGATGQRISQARQLQRLENAGVQSPKEAAFGEISEFQNRAGPGANIQSIQQAIRSRQKPVGSRFFELGSLEPQIQAQLAQQQQLQALRLQQQRQLQDKVAQIRSSPPGAWRFETGSRDQQDWTNAVRMISEAEQNEKGLLSPSEQMRVRDQGNRILRQIAARVQKVPQRTMKEDIAAGINAMQDGDYFYFKNLRTGGIEQFERTPEVEAVIDAMQAGTFAEVKPGVYARINRDGNTSMWGFQEKEEKDEDLVGPDSSDLRAARKDAIAELKNLGLDPTEDDVQKRQDVILRNQFPAFYEQQARQAAARQLAEQQAERQRQAMVARRRAMEFGAGQATTPPARPSLDLPLGMSPLRHGPPSQQPPSPVKQARDALTQIGRQEAAQGHDKLSEWTAAAKKAARPAARILLLSYLQGLREQGLTLKDLSPEERKRLKQLDDLVEGR